MPDRAALSPESRVLYGEILRAPIGYELDAAVATTYSLDFETALVIPATLAFHAAENRMQTLDTPLALLEGLERIASKLAIFCEGGRIAGIPRGANRLTALLEDTVTEVAAPRGGAFHPKLWLLRFTSVSGLEEPKMRLALLSRNLTTDMSWDLSLALDGAIGTEAEPGNAPISSLLHALPDMSSGRKTPRHVRNIVTSLAKDVERTKWFCPSPMRSVSFAVNGLTDKPWRPKIGAKIGIISPFVTDGALEALVRGIDPENAWLLGRSEELALLKGETIDKFGHVQVLDDMAETEDGEDVSEEAHSKVPARGLHAKAFITERYSSTEITMGSGNATSAALLSGSNVEVFATLSGYIRDIGSVEDQMAPENLGRFLRDFVPESADPAGADLAVERRADALLREIAKASPRLRCEAGPDNSVTLFLSVKEAVNPPEGLSLRIWPLVAGEAWGIDVTTLSKTEFMLGRLALRDVTRWIGLRLLDRETGFCRDVSLGAELIDLPETRTEEILRAIIENREAFLRYLRLLLGDVSDAAKTLLAAGSGGGADWGSSDADAPILENLVRALTGDGRQLRDVDRLITRLGDAAGSDGPLIPPEFRMLWTSFRAVIPKAKGSRK